MSWPRSVQAIETADVLALLEEGPKRSAELAGWLSCQHWQMTQALTRLAAEGVIERHGLGKAARWCLPGTVTTRASDWAAVDRAGAVQVAEPAPVSFRKTAVKPDDKQRVIRRIEDEELEVVWNGVGPLPGAGSAAGLGSSLSGAAFFVGKRS